jgi:transcriptional regulator
MYRPPAYAEDDVARLHRFVDNHPFVTIAAMVEGRPQFAYAPVMLDRAHGKTGRLRFHLARANPVTRAAAGTIFCFSFKGPDAYISPDWYRSDGLVPTWNYLAVEAAGPAERLDSAGLECLLVDLSARQEAALAPKKPWTLDKVPAERLSVLMNAIVGFSVLLESLEGKFKLSQDKPAQDRERVIEELERLGSTSSGDIAHAMRGASAR